MAERVSKADVTAFRLGAHRLVDGLGETDMLEAAGRCGIQNSPPGSALLALHARVRDITPGQMTAAVGDEKSLLQSWCMRGAPFFFPTADAAVFTTGVIPPTEEAMRHFILGVGPAVDKLGLSLTETVELAGAEIGDVLTGRRLAIDELGAQIAERIARELPRRRRAVWEEEGPYAAGQPLGEAIVHFCIRILAVQGIVCFAPRVGNKAPFVLTGDWLGDPIPDIEPEVARAELLRRYLRCYGPSTRQHFAAWSGIRTGDTEPWWGLIEDELTPVEFDGTSWILTENLDTLRSSPTPKGVRLLPPRDPYTQLRDRETIVAEKHHRDVWKTVGEPGTVLADGQIAGIWRPRKRGRKLTITVETFRPIQRRLKDTVRDEGEQVASLRGASSVDVVFETR